MTPYFQALLERSIYEVVRLRLVDSGLTPDITLFPNTQAGYNSYIEALESISDTYGFSVELFNVSSNMSRGLKKVPRVVISHHSIIPGNWGSEPNTYKKLQDGAFNLVKLDRVSMEMFFNCIVITNSTSQLRQLNSVITQSLPSIGYVPYYTEGASQEDFMVHMVSGQPLTDNYSGIFESRFFYSIPDIILNEVTDPYTVPPIKNIELNTKIANELGLTLNITNND